MAEITAGQVKALRDKTGAGMMDCKNVLVEAGGDLERATDLLRERDLLKARKKTGRATSEGRIAAAVSDDGRRAALVEVNCETDFVARTDDFESLCDELAAVARDSGAADVDALLAVSAGGSSMQDRLTEAVGKLGENIQVRRVLCLAGGEKSCIRSYIHGGGKIGALVGVDADDPSSEEVAALAYNLCMHVAASAPSGISRDDLPQDEVERERNVLRAQAEGEGKPANVVEKMVEGRLNKFFKEVVLLEQPLVMDPDQTVKNAVASVGAQVVEFRRFQLGEEIAE